MATRSLEKSHKYASFVWLLTFVFYVSGEASYYIREKVIICGVCKDVASRIPYTIQIVEKIASFFEDYRIVVYENNSSDNTPQIIKEWQDSNDRVLAIFDYIPDVDMAKTIVNVRDGKFFVPELIAGARNIVLDIIMSDEYSEFTHIIWIDLDFKIEPNYEGIIEVFKSKKNGMPFSHTGLIRKETFGIGLLSEITRILLVLNYLVMIGIPLSF